MPTPLEVLDALPVAIFEAHLAGDRRLCRAIARLAVDRQWLGVVVATLEGQAVCGLEECDSGPNKGMPGPCPKTGPQIKAERENVTQQARDAVNVAVAKTKDMLRSAPNKVAELMKKNPHVTAVATAVRGAEQGEKGKAAAKAIAQEAGKKLGKTALEKVTGFSTDLWNDVADKHGVTAAVIASGAYIVLNKASLSVELAAGVRLVPGVGGALATARTYAVYYGVRAAVKVTMLGLKKAGEVKRSVLGVESFQEGDGGLTPESVIAALREYDAILSEAAGVEPGGWTDEEILQAIATAMEDESSIEEATNDGEDLTPEQAEAIAGILVAIYGDDALSHFDDGDAELTEARKVGDKWQGPSGRWFTVNTSGRVVPTKSPDNGTKGGLKSVAKQKVDHKANAAAAIKDAKAGKLNADELASKLHGMTVADLNAIKKEHGLKASGNKAELVKKLSERLTEKFGGTNDSISQMKSPPKAKSSRPDKMAKKMADIKSKLEEMVPIEDKEKPRPLGKMGSQTHSALTSSIESNHNLSVAQKKEYSVAIRKVAGRIPEAAHVRISQNLGKATFHSSKDGISEAVWKITEKEMGWEGKPLSQLAELTKKKTMLQSIAGVYYTSGKELHLDGPSERASVGMGIKAHGLGHTHVYAHELAHVIDGPNFELSGNPKWGDAFSTELKVSGESPPLTAYAGVKPSEGFAEFSRLLYGGGVNLAEVEKRFPKCTAYFKENKLWPT